MWLRGSAPLAAGLFDEEQQQQKQQHHERTREVVVLVEETLRVVVKAAFLGGGSCRRLWLRNSTWHKGMKAVGNFIFHLFFFENLSVTVEEIGYTIHEKIAVQRSADH